MTNHLSKKEFFELCLAGIRAAGESATLYEQFPEQVTHLGGCLNCFQEAVRLDKNMLPLLEPLLASGD